jgi:hypothetical protein
VSGRKKEQRRRSAPSLWGGVERAARVFARRTGGRSPRELVLRKQAERAGARDRDRMAAPSGAVSFSE